MARLESDIAGSEGRQPQGYLVSGDASACYPGLLSRFVRTILFLPPDVVVIRDLMECAGERRIEWLFHPEGELTDLPGSEGRSAIITNGGARLTVTAFLPDPASGWRVSDVVRTSYYEDSNARRPVSRSIRYRSLQPFRPARRFEFLVGMVASDAGGADAAGAAPAWRFEPGEETGGTEGAVEGGNRRPGTDWRLTLSAGGASRAEGARELVIEAGQMETESSTGSSR